MTLTVIGGGFWLILTVMQSNFLFFFFGKGDVLYTLGQVQAINDGTGEKVHTKHTANSMQFISHAWMALTLF